MINKKLEKNAGKKMGFKAARRGWATRIRRQGSQQVVKALAGS